MSSYDSPRNRPPRDRGLRLASKVRDRDLAKSWAHRHPSQRVIRRRRIFASALGVMALAIGLTVMATSGAGSTRSSRPPAASAARKAPSLTTRQIPAIEAGVLPWNLPSPISREVVLPGSGNAVTVVGGYSATGSSLSTILSLDTTSGAASSVGSLAAGVHDAAGAELGTRDFLIGGGSPTTIPDVESFPAPPAPVGTAAVVGSLPQPRSDASAVTVDGKIFVVGGYDGTNPDAEVTSTSDGVHFADVASLPVPVRYAAVAAVGDKIYLFGGEAVTGAQPGDAVADIQMVDTTTMTARVVGHMPEATAGASAAVIEGNLYVAGGVLASAAPASPTSTAAPASPASPTSTAGSQATAASGPGPVSDTATGDVFAFDPSKDDLLRAGTLPVPVAYSGVQVVGSHAWLVGGETTGTPVSSVEMLTPNSAFGYAGSTGAGSPFFGDKLLIADRGNNRLLLLDDTNQIIWTYPSDYAAAPPGGFYFPDDAFFAKQGTEIISNQEQNETIVIIAFPSGQLLWQYGHPRQPGTAPGFLHEPDDAYLLKNGQVTVADADGCRVLFINPDKTVASQIGTNNVCMHKPPNYVGSPNGDTPLEDGNVLVSEINGQWVSEYTPGGQLVWTVHLPIHYPSDPQQLGPDLYLVSDYSLPGAILEFNREGQVLYKYAPTSGPGELNQPSLTEQLPSGVFMSNDDYNDRMVAIDPYTQALVWQYGMTGIPGTAPGMLNTPDGFDLLAPDGSTPTHPATA